MGDMHASSVRFINIKILQLSTEKIGNFRVLSSNHNYAFLALFLLLLLIQTSSPATAQFAEPTQDPNRNNKSDFVIMGIVVIMFFISGFLSLYSRRCAGARVPIINLSLPNVDTDNRPSHTESNNGLNQEIIDTFPTFLYSNVKGLKIGKGTLACAVCLNEFQDEETLRLIPKCNHVFHPSCIDVWLASHSTCPLCRANLVPRPEDMVPMVSIQIPRSDADDHHHDYQHPNEEESIATGDNDVESQSSPKVDYLLHRSHTMNHSRPTRSRSTRFLFNVLFPRCNSTGHTHQHGENLGRFTLRLPDEFRGQVLNLAALKRTNSSVCFTRMSSERKSYRTRSVGSGGGRSYLQHEEEWGFTLTPSFFARNRSVRKSNVQYSGVALLDDNIVRERSSDLLCPG